MNRRAAYLALSLVGLVVPYALFLPWVVDHGLNLPLFARELFANRIGGFFGLDVLVSAVVLIGFVRVEGARLGMTRLWLPVLCTLLVGVSCGFPLFLYMREPHLRAVR
jgi:hypothetical protein